MRILFFIDSLISGGKERRIVELMKGLKQSPGVEFEIVLMNDQVHYQEVFAMKVPVHYLIRKTKRDISVFKRFYRICKDFKPDIVHCWDSMTAVYAVPVCKLLGIKLINGMVVDTPVTRNFSNKYWMRGKLTFPFSNLVLGNSKAGLNAYGAPAGKSACVYNGMNFSRFNGLRDAGCVRKEFFGETSGHELFVAGMVAAFEPRKDYATLVRTAAKMCEKFPSLRFVLVGGGADFDSIRSLVPAGLADRILFPGKRQDVESIVNIFDVGILLTNSLVHGEGISNSILEYMAMGKAVIATKGGGTNEIVEDGVTGFLINPAAGNELEEKLEILMSDESLRKKMGEAGKKRVLQDFSIDKMVSAFMTHYQRLTA